MSDAFAFGGYREGLAVSRVLRMIAEEEASSGRRPFSLFVSPMDWADLLAEADRMVWPPRRIFGGQKVEWIKVAGVLVYPVEP